MAKKGTAVAGQACTVTDGPNKGKKGTYTRDDEGNLWCEGDWGGTECRGGRCADANVQASVFEYVDIDGNLVHEVDGIFEVEGLGIFQGNAILNAATGERRKVTVVPIAAASLTALRESGSEIEQRAADVLEAHLRSQGGGSRKVT
jgi:hypothetical protein